MTTVMLAATVLFVITACAVVGMTTGRFSFKNQRDYSKLFMAALSSDKICIGECYGLPEEYGWVIDYFYVDDYGTLIRYSREEKIVSIKQSIIHENMGNVNTENAVIESMSIYKENDGFFIEFQSGSCGLWWVYDGYLLNLVGNIAKKER